MKSRGPPLEEIDRTVRRLDGESASVKNVMPDEAGDVATDEEMVHGLVLLVAHDAREVVRQPMAGETSSDPTSVEAS